jgi:sulfate adenylyltransferase
MLEERPKETSFVIRPHGSATLAPRYVADPEDRAELLREARALPSVVVSSGAAANAVMLGAGYFNPLEGFHGLADTLSIAESLHTRAGLFWPIPVVCLVPEAAVLRGASRVALRDPGLPGAPVLAVLDLAAVETVSDEQLERVCTRVFRTADPAHPGVAALGGAGRVLLSGPVHVLSYSYFERDFPQTFRTAPALRAELAARGWERTVAFQTRNPMHRAHEELCRMAMADTRADGLLVHMLLGRLKKGDIPASVRDAAIRVLVDRYFPAGRVLVAGYGFDMLYAGPREAVLHAVFRQNAGCSHLIVGRDHAGVGSYYGPFDAQTIFEREVPPGALAIEVYRADNTAWSSKLGRVVMMRDARDHAPEDFVQLSGTKVRELLARGEPLPEEFTRPEVAEILRNYYQSEDARETTP